MPTPFGTEVRGRLGARRFTTRRGGRRRRLTRACGVESRADRRLSAWPAIAVCRRQGGHLTMRSLTVLLAMLAALAAPIAADEDRRFPANATFTTLQITPLAIEGLTGDEFGNLYTTGRAAAPARCPVWQIGP